MPRFYFGAHFALIHAAAAAGALVRYGSWHWFFESPDLGNYPFTRPPGWGYSLPVVYTLWIVVVVSLYPACKRMVQIKASRAHPWLRYF